MEFPSELKYTKEHVWVKVNGNTAKIGITDYAQEQLGDILFVDLPAVGDQVNVGETFTEVESSKTATEVASPVTGEIVAVNEELDDSPEAINDDAYEAWIIEVEVTDGIEDLLTAEEYEDSLEE